MELKTKHDTPDLSNLQKCADFVHAFILGFDIADALALLRVDELYVDSFEIKDVKTLRGNICRVPSDAFQEKEARPSTPSRTRPRPA